MESGAGVVRLCRRRGRRKTNVSIPHDLILNILSRLPVRSLVRFKCVCKLWYNLLTHDPYFIAMHLDRSRSRSHYRYLFSISNHIYALDYFHACSPRALAYNIDLKFMLDSSGPSKERPWNPRIDCGSCNGLFLVTRMVVGCKLFYLWNPATRQHKELIPELLARFRNPILSGLGYDSTNNDYKVVFGLVSSTSRDRYDYDFLIYSLRANSVKRTHISPLANSTRMSHGPAMFLKDSIHWLSAPITSISQVRESYEIVAFDVTKEICKQVPMPNLVKNIFAIKSLKIGILKDCLCLYLVDRRGVMHVSMMKEYGVKESWTYLFALYFIDRECQWFRAFFISDNEQEVVMEAHPYPGRAHLVVYNREKRGVTYVTIGHLCNWDYKVSPILPYVESLVPLSTREIN